jgi:hypothetical protein
MRFRTKLLPPFSGDTIDHLNAVVSYQVICRNSLIFAALRISNFTRLSKVDLKANYMFR